jgi:hypothetical protein
MRGNRVHFKMLSTEKFVDSCLAKTSLREKSVERPQRLTFQSEEFAQMSSEELKQRYSK